MENYFLMGSKKRKAQEIATHEALVADTRKKLYFAVLLAAIFFVIGIIAYHIVEGWGWVDSIYFMSATMTTVGYGDISPKSDIGKLMTVLVIWIGVSIGFYLIFSFSKFREVEVDSRIKKFIGSRGGRAKAKK